MKLNVYSQASLLWKLPDLIADIPLKIPFFMKCIESSDQPTNA